MHSDDKMRHRSQGLNLKALAQPVLKYATAWIDGLLYFFTFDAKNSVFNDESPIESSIFFVRSFRSGKFPRKVCLIIFLKKKKQIKRSCAFCFINVFNQQSELTSFLTTKEMRKINSAK